MKTVYSLALVIVLVFSITVFAGDKKTVNINIEGMTCNGCVQKVESTLKKVNGVTETTVTLASHSATVTYDVEKANEESLTKAVNSTGYKVLSVKETDQKDSMVSQKAGCSGGCCSAPKKSKNI